MKLTRNQLIEIIKDKMIIYETTAPDRAITSRILQGIVDSKFWTMPHREYDVELVDKHTFSTPAIEILMDALNDAASNAKTDLYFILSVTDDETYTLGPDDKFGGYPNNWMMRGQYRGPESGKHIVWLEFRPYSDDYQLSELDPNELVKIISRTINHELVHYYQLKKQAKNKGLSDIEAYREMVYDPKQVPTTDDRETYLTRHGEIDAYAHEAAEQLVDTYGVQKSLKAIKNLTPVDINKYPEISTVVLDYADVLKDNPAELNKFRKKVYQQIQNQL